MLAAFADALSPADRLVSYNGKSYDLPLLITPVSHAGAGAPL